MRKRLRAFALSIFFILLMVGALILALPWVAERVLVQQLAAQGIQLEVGHLEINLFTGEIRVAQAGARTPDGKGFELRELGLTLRYAPLLERRLHLASFEVHGLNVDIERQDDHQLAVAGLLLPTSSEASSGPAWGIGLDSVVVTDTRLRYSDPLLSQTLIINATSVNDIASWSPEQAIHLEAQASFDGGRLQLEGSVKPFGERIEITLQMNTDALPVESVRPYLGYGIEGVLDAELAIQMQYVAGQGSSLELDGQVGGQALAFNVTESLQARVAQLDWQGKATVQVNDAAGSPDVDANGRLTATGVRVEEVSAARQLLSAERIEASRLRLEKTRFLEISGARLSGLQAAATRTASGQWDLPAGQQAAADTGVSGPAETGDDRGPTFQFRLADLKVEGNSEISIRDESVKPVFENRLSEIKLALGEIDSRQPAHKTPVEIAAKVGRYGRLELSGNIQPLLAQPAVNLEGKVIGADLVPMGGYTRSLIGYRIKQGTVTSDLDIQIREGNVASSFDLVLNKIQVVGIKGRTTEFKNQLGMSLPAALKLMRDRDDNIRLNLPVKGPLDNPEVGIEDVMSKALIKAVQFGVLSFYSPLGVVMAADKLVQFATALRFKPVSFEPASALLPQTESEYLDKVAEQLARRPQHQLSVCGFATESDRQAMAENVSASRKGLFRFFRGEPEAEDVSEDDALALARKRSELVIDYLLARGMKEEQLIPCESELDNTEGADPRVELNL